MMEGDRKFGTKRINMEDPSSCLNKAKDDEPIFVLLGRDPTAAATVRFWVEERIRLGKNSLADGQILDALRWAKLAGGKPIM